MSKVKPFCPPWEWWIQTGERMVLGMGIRDLLDGAGLKQPRHQQGLSRTRLGIEEGQPVVRAMKLAGMNLPLEAWCLLESGELTGRLGEMLMETGQVLKRRKETRKNIMGQLWYPAMVFAVGSVVMALILFWVIPQLRETSASMGLGEHLPWFTENIGWLYGSVLCSLVGGVGLAGFACVLSNRLARESLRWAGLSEQIVGNIPCVGGLVYRIREARVLRQLGTLVNGGITLPLALEMIAEPVTNKWIRNELYQWRSRLLMGGGFREAVEACGLIDAGDVPLIMAGQESGQLDTYLGQISDDLLKQVSRNLESWCRLLEPTVLLGLSCAVGGLVLAYLLPMVRMLEQAGGAF